MTGNTADGYQALFSNTLGLYNSASGYQALYSNIGDSSGHGWANTASGYQVLYSNTMGFGNIASGYQALYSNSTGGSNIAAGYQSLYNNTSGSANIATGDSAMYQNTTGAGNTAVGWQALFSNSTGSYNTAIGYEAWTGGGNGLNLTNATAIGAHAFVTESNALVLGASANVGIGTSAPSNIFTIGQGAGHAIADGWDTYSSRRWKTNIHRLHGALNKVEQLRGVSYDLKETGKHEVGVIAEEVGAVVPEIVSWEKNGKDAQGVDYSRLTALLIEATKEQQILIRKQAEQIRAQQRQIRAERTRSDTQQTEIARLTSQVKGIQLSLKTNSGTDAGVRMASVRAPAVVR